MDRPTLPTFPAVYTMLSDFFGFQGWWPILGRSGSKGYDSEGYRLRTGHTAELTQDERFEVAVGAILTQNTAWENARRALGVLREQGLLTVRTVEGVEASKVAPLIRTSGYYNQKARKIGELARAWEGICKAPDTQLRTALLKVWGIGPETADSIALYGFDVPCFIVDGYAMRVFRRMGLLVAREGYERIRSFVEESFDRDGVRLGEFHALLVRLGQGYCRARPQCTGCPLLRVCATGIAQH